MGVMSKAAIVIPCYNETRRFDADQFRKLASGPHATLFFVNDGSTDDTESTLRRFIASFPLATAPALLSLPANRGKGEAVRLGLQAACQKGFSLVGYYDADLATPPEELLRLIELAAAGPQSVIMGSRVKLLGSNIQRTFVRHVTGRFFATAASWVLKMPVYDTQCGAKLFHCSPTLEAALKEPFSSRWCFDVELIGRLLFPLESGIAGLSQKEFLEIPLKTWRGIAGSHLNPGSMLAAALDLIKIGIALNRRRTHRHAYSNE